LNFAAGADTGGFAGGSKPAGAGWAEQQSVFMKRGLTAGVPAGAVVAAFAILFGILGLTPSLSWIPEVPLLTIAGVAPIAVLTVAGYRAFKSFRSILIAAIAGSTAGGIGGFAGGVTYVMFGKSTFNVVAGAIVGIGVGAALGAAGALVAARRPRPPSP
jgi:hypothetical protein